MGDHCYYCYYCCYLFLTLNHGAYRPENCNCYYNNYYFNLAFIVIVWHAGASSVRRRTVSSVGIDGRKLLRSR